MLEADRQSGAKGLLAVAGFNMRAVPTIREILNYWERTGEEEGSNRDVQEVFVSVRVDAKGSKRAS